MRCPRLRWAGWRALALPTSLLAHALVGLALWHLPAPEDRSAAHGRPIDTRADGRDFSLTLNEPVFRAYVPIRVLTPGPAHEPAPATPVPAAPAAAMPTAGARQAADRGTPRAAGTPAGGPGGAGSGGGAAGPTTAFFQIAVRARSVVYVLDRSASMGLHGALAAARAELGASLRRLPADVRFQVIAYNRSADPLRVAGHTSLAPATSENCRAAEALLANLPAEGGTDHAAALHRAIVLQPDVIFFLTDAADLTDAQVRELTRLNHGRTAIHAVELRPPSRDHSPLRLLTEANHGVYRQVDPRAIPTVHAADARALPAARSCKRAGSPAHG